jgi:dTDP-4-amino-4,6-dideoxygalactose transaminase
MSDAVADFQSAFADIFDATRAEAFWKGRVALYAILEALDVGPGDEVLLPGYTCVMNVNPIMYRGATPVYVDIEPDTFNLDPDLLARKITPRSRVLIAQHTYGYPADMDRLAAIADRHNITLIEDCCLALGSTYKGKLCGTFGRAAYFSFQWNKPFTTGVGGLAIANDADLADRLQHFAREALSPAPRKAAALLAAQRAFHRAVVYPKTSAVITKTFRWLTRKGLVVGSSSNEEFRPEMPPGFLRSMSPSQARAGLRGLRRLDDNIRHRRHMTDLYDRLLTEAGLTPAARPADAQPVLVRYPVRVPDKPRAIAEAPAAKVELGTWFECPLHPEETPMELYHYTPGLCPVAEDACRHVVNLPTHPRANDHTARRSVNFIRELTAQRLESQP